MLLGTSFVLPLPTSRIVVIRNSKFRIRRESITKGSGTINHHTFLEVLRLIHIAETILGTVLRHQAIIVHLLAIVVCIIRIGINVVIIISKRTYHNMAFYAAHSRCQHFQTRYLCTRNQRVAIFI